jgi:metal-responsive CopG/Arc/MetJ family transcriptional regulator
MKTAISLPDELFAEADRLARRLDKSRSQLYREAVAEYVARHDPEEITRLIDVVAERLDPRDDGFARAAARHALGRTEW